MVLMEEGIDISGQQRMTTEQARSKHLIFLKSETGKMMGGGFCLLMGGN